MEAGATSVRQEVLAFREARKTAKHIRARSISRAMQGPTAREKSLRGRARFHCNSNASRGGPAWEDRHKDLPVPPEGVDAPRGGRGPRSLKDPPSSQPPLNKTLLQVFKHLI